MKKRCNLPMLVFVSLLILLSSCAVQKGVQVGVNLPVNKQLNYSITTGPVRVQSTPF
jgi:hypothetical protein